MRYTVRGCASGLPGEHEPRVLQQLGVGILISQLHSFLVYAGGAHLPLGDWFQSVLCCLSYRLAFLCPGKFIFKFRLHGALRVLGLYHPSEM